MKITKMGVECQIVMPKITSIERKQNEGLKKILGQHNVKAIIAKVKPDGLYMIKIMQSIRVDFIGGRVGDTVFFHLAPQSRLVYSKISRCFDPVPAVLVQYLQDCYCLGLLQGGGSRFRAFLVAHIYGIKQFLR